MAETKHTGIVIKQIDFDDFDQIVTILTQDGFLPFIALGVRKMTSKNRVALQLGNIIEVEIFQARLVGKLSKLKRATLVKQPPIKKADTALILLDTIKYLNKVDVPQREVLNTIYEAFDWLGGEYNHHFKSFVIFNTLPSLGLFRYSDSCAECGRKDRIQGFEFYKGGFTCILHTKAKRELRFLKAVHAIQYSMKEYAKTDHDINAQVLKELESYINESNW